jgi:hypothetical protein
MNPTAQQLGILRIAFEHPTRGVVGLVEDLLTICGEYGLQLHWQDGRCRVRTAGGDQEELIDVPLRKSVFRAILARVAALCNERTPNSVSPYGGQGELAGGAHPPTVFRATFLNTPPELQLELLIAPGRTTKQSQQGVVTAPFQNQRPTPATDTGVSP